MRSARPCGTPRAPPRRFGNAQKRLQAQWRDMTCAGHLWAACTISQPKGPGFRCSMRAFMAQGRDGARLRSEEHTSELQSLMRISYAVFCLKKKNINNQHTL